ncbi:helix-turn-helix domain-containing protein [Aeromicrobium sp.]|uniref:TetR/AcrR family transcriptional regulator n=1 Tax=Aeromicrobium sp. TaxID=1871063 RepID=UPI0030BF1CEE
MGDSVKGQSRAYDASGRREAARATRRTVVAAAKTLLEERGYNATTFAEVARRAGVSPASVYQRFGNKAALFKEVFDDTIAGDDEPVAVAERPEALRIQEEPDVKAKLRIFAEGAATRAARSARVQLALRNGAPIDPAVADLWQLIQAQRLTGMTMLASHLVDTGRLRTGIEVAEAREVLWTCISVEVYDLFVIQRGWSRDAYAEWLYRTLIASLTEQ